MKLFECQNCKQPLYFEHMRCESCGLRLGYLPEQAMVTALEEVEGLWRALATPTARFRLCANARYDVCNWLIPSDDPEEFCAACRHNRTIPDLSVADNLQHWRKIELAKRRLFYTLLRLQLPHATKNEDPNGLAFDFVASPLDATAAPIMTGHTGGLITLNVAEADDIERERQRKSMGEPYRTLVGHFRHEIAHFYWDQLVAGRPVLDDFRRLFGDERVDYGEALKRHYAEGPAPDWADHFITAYASAHPWEDFAETWAHYFHMVDTLETAFAFGLRLRPKVGTDLTAAIDFDPHVSGIDRIIDAWLPLTFAVNSINRSMGQPDLYPFALPPEVILKLAFVHEQIHAVGPYPSTNAELDALRAILAGLKRAVGSPAPPE